jgi:hypothetical protein
MIESGVGILDAAASRDPGTADADACRNLANGMTQRQRRMLSSGADVGNCDLSDLL